MTFACDLRDLTIAEARDALAAGNVSAREPTEAHLAAIEGARDLNALSRRRPTAPSRTPTRLMRAGLPARRWDRWTASRWQSRICSAPTG